MKSDYTTNSRYITHTIAFWKVGRIHFLSSGVKGLKACGAHLTRMNSTGTKPAMNPDDPIMPGGHQGRSFAIVSQGNGVDVTGSTSDHSVDVIELKVGHGYMTLGIKQSKNLHISMTPHVWLQILQARPATYRPRTDHPTTYRPPDHIPTTHRSPLPTTYWPDQPHTDHHWPPLPTTIERLRATIALVPFRMKFSSMSESTQTSQADLCDVKRCSCVVFSLKAGRKDLTNRHKSLPHPPLPLCARMILKKS